MGLRLLASLVLSFALAGCPQPGAAEGPQGPTGPTGPQGERGEPGEAVLVDGGVVVGPQGPPGTSVEVTALPAGDAACPQGGVRLSGANGVTVVCHGTAGVPGMTGATGAQGPVGATGPAGLQGAAGPSGPAGATGPAGAVGATGSTGATGVAGPAGAPGAQGPAGPAGTSVSVTVLASGDVSCPYGGARFTVGTTVNYACNGAPGPAGPPGSGGGSSGGGPNGAPAVTLAGFTSTTYTGNLGGRAGAHQKCAAAFPESHFCTNWEWDNAGAPGPVPGGAAWVDIGTSDANSRFYRSTGAQTSTCNNWTADQPNATYASNLVRGTVVNAEGGFTNTFVAAGDGGCQTPRPLTCCYGGSSVRFWGFTPQSYAGNLGGRAGANAVCHQAFSGSHMCTTWEYDQAAAAVPVPTAGAWVDIGVSDLTDRYTRSYGAQTSTCHFWTTDQQNATYASNLVRGTYVDTLGVPTNTFIATGNGGCQNPRPVACCG